MAFGGAGYRRRGLFGSPGIGLGWAPAARAGRVPVSIPSSTAWNQQQVELGMALGGPGNWRAPGLNVAPDVPVGAVPGSIPSSTAWGWEVPEQATGPGWTTWREQLGAPQPRSQPTDRRTTTGGRYSAAPPGVNQKWWNEFTDQHEGQNPLEYYGAQGEGLAEAMGDLEWSQGFQEMYGRPPSDDDWRLWWYQKRGLRNPDKPRRRQQAQVEQPEERPPLWVPPMIVWR